MYKYLQTLNEGQYKAATTIRGRFVFSQEPEVEKHIH